LLWQRGLRHVLRLEVDIARLVVDDLGLEKVLATPLVIHVALLKLIKTLSLLLGQLHGVKFVLRLLRFFCHASLLDSLVNLLLCLVKILEQLYEGELGVELPISWQSNANELWKTFLRRQFPFNRFMRLCLCLVLFSCQVGI
jgi:hypothetical protein